MIHETINALLAECERDLASLRATLTFAEIRGDSIDKCEPFIHAMAATFHRTLAYAARAIKRENSGNQKLRPFASNPSVQRERM